MLACRLVGQEAQAAGHRPDPDTSALGVREGCRWVRLRFYSRGVTDRRVQRTRQALHTAMLHSLATQPWDEIHVQGLCERANVGRSTFYGHFPSREALLRDGLAAMGARFLALGQARAHAASLPLRFVEPMLAHLLEQRSTFHTLLARTANAYVHQQMQAMVNDLVAHELARQGLPPSWRTESLAHALGGATFDVPKFGHGTRAARGR